MTDTLRQSRSPLYLQIAEILRQNLGRGVWTPGELLPTISELSAEYSVAKITVRQAVKILEEEGLLDSRRGRGTTVLPPPPARDRLHLGTRLSTLVDLYRGDKPALDLLEDRDAEVPGEPLIGELSDRGYHLLRRTHSRDGETYCVISIYFDKDLFARHEAELRTKLALPVLVDSEDIDVARARQSLTIGKCDYELAVLLGLAVGDPVVEVRRVICDRHDRVLYLADVTYRSDFVRLEMDLLA
ncbi:MAG: GntR family transcriptional regulator [Boseongicola sp. SB0676_bin_33]|uniref:GntR family transcriptional regulator n=1 Tax=Boseongicola sp. SB0664_bin_43 TaxID=2604844 RepID=A0A6B0Y606_9RHOB|nr:GntR family transcriptional regulator [Boseongicola sp. SB0664_bin_43]MYF88035.1 GntR family transcriptional regulator [Boseongicola sp. SB0676_bin_33]